MDERLYFKPPDYWITNFELSELAYEHYTNQEYQQLLEVSKKRKLFLETASSEFDYQAQLAMDWGQVYSYLSIAHYYLGNFAEFKHHILQARIHTYELTYEVKALELLFLYKHSELLATESKIFAWEIEQVLNTLKAKSFENVLDISICPQDITKCTELLRELLSHLLLENGFTLTVNRSVNIQIITNLIAKLKVLLDPFQLAS